MGGHEPGVCLPSANNSACVFLSFVTITLLTTFIAAPVWASTAAITDTTNDEPDFSLGKLIRLQEAGGSLLEKAVRAIGADASALLPTRPDSNTVNAAREEVGTHSFIPTTVINDELPTVKFVQKYRGVEVWGQDGFVHFDRNGNVHDVVKKPFPALANVEPTVPPDDVKRILEDRYQGPITLSRPIRLQAFRDFKGNPRLIYRITTQATDHLFAKEILLDAHSGEIIAEASVAFRFDGPRGTPTVYRGRRTVYSADTQAAHAPYALVPSPRAPGTQEPKRIDPRWYLMTLEDDVPTGPADASSSRAYENAGRVWDYYFKTFGRKSYDGKDSRMRSIVHAGVRMVGASWVGGDSQVLIYGDGDGKKFLDSTLGLDVAGHEFTHALIESSSALTYWSEPGSLNESYCDFFGKMIAHNGPDNWDLGATIVGPEFPGRAMRNMLFPERYHQPSSTSSPWRISVDGPCNDDNDRCGIHANSGIPNRAAALIVTAIGKMKTEHLYYNVLTKRLTATTTFREARAETEQECQRMFGPNSRECKYVAKAFAIVGM